MPSTCGPTSGPRRRTSRSSTSTTYIEDALAGDDALGRPPSSSATAWAACWRSRLAERAPIAGLVLLAPEPPRDLPRAGPPARGRDIARRVQALELGWARCPRSCQRQHPDLTLADVLRDPAPHGSPRVGPRPPADARGRAGRPAALSGATAGHRRRARSPVPEADSERLAEWLGAQYQPFGAHSHYGLVLGEESYEQVAEAIRAFLEPHRL